jgi:hypothetical protein
MTATAYQSLFAESARTGWPYIHQTDLTVYDHKRLTSDDAPSVFGWVLRKFGTEILDPRMGPLALESYLDHYRVDGTKNLYYWYTGQKLVGVTFHDFCELMRLFHSPN